MPTLVYGNQPETILYSKANDRSKKLNHVLMGTLLEVVEEQGAWLKVITKSAGKGGWVKKSDTRNNQGLKVFYVDVGQGDGAIIESPEGLILIDGGPTAKYHQFMKWRYKNLIKENGKITIKAMVLSHPDQDHYEGFISVLKNKDFHVETIYHNGIKRYSSSNMPTGLDFDLGQLSTKTLGGQKEHVLTETFDSIEDARAMIATGDFVTKTGRQSTFNKFWTAAIEAHDAGRVGISKRLTGRTKALPGFKKKDADKLFIEVLGPIPTKNTGKVEYVTFPDAHRIKLDRDDPLDASEIPAASSSHTRNGHSIVLKLHYGKHSFLFGGDLNIPAQLHLMKHYGDENPFRADVSKACHHGSSDFHVDFLKLVRPQANVVSSGDNKSFDHPVADAVGTLCKHTKGNFPLFFSTELARATSGDKVHYGLINARSNGKTLVMAQMKEQHKKADVWDSFTIPWKGKFHDVLQGKHETDRLA